MKHTIRLICIISIFFAAGISDFSYAYDITFPLNGVGITWQSSESATPVTVVTLQDSNGYGFLYTNVPSLQGSYIFSFDYKTDASPVAGGIFSDLFSVSLFFNTFPYLVPDPTPIAVLDVTASNVTPYGSTISGLSDGWFQVTLSFNNTADPIIPVFELFDLDGEFGNSTASVRNVSLVASVPETSSWMFLGAGIAGVGLMLFIQRRRLENLETFMKSKF